MLPKRQQRIEICTRDVDAPKPLEGSRQLTTTNRSREEDALLLLKRLLVIHQGFSPGYFHRCRQYPRSHHIHNSEPIMYITSKRGTKLVLFKGNTYTPNQKIYPGQRSRDWKCTLYHKERCRARIVTKYNSFGLEYIDEKATKHSHAPIFKF